MEHSILKKLSPSEKEQFYKFLSSKSPGFMSKEDFVNTMEMIENFEPQPNQPHPKDVLILGPKLKKFIEDSGDDSIINQFSWKSAFIPLNESILNPVNLKDPFKKDELIMLSESTTSKSILKQWLYFSHNDWPENIRPVLLEYMDELLADELNTHILDEFWNIIMVMSYVAGSVETIKFIKRIMMIIPNELKNALDDSNPNQINSLKRLAGFYSECLFYSTEDLYSYEFGRNLKTILEGYKKVNEKLNELNEPKTKIKSIPIKKVDYSNLEICLAHYFMGIDINRINAIKILKKYSKNKSVNKFMEYKIHKLSDHELVMTDDKAADTKKIKAFLNAGMLMNGEKNKWKNQQVEEHYNMTFRKLKENYKKKYGNLPPFVPTHEW